MQGMMGEGVAISSFGGSDAVILINGVACGEIVSFKYNTSNKLIHIKTGLFGELSKDIVPHSTEDLLTNLSCAVIEQIYSNEQGFTCYRAFKGVNLSHQSGETDADFVVQKEIYHYNYETKSNLYVIPETMKTSSAVEQLRKNLKIKLNGEW